MLKKILKKISFIRISYSLMNAVKNKDSLFKRISFSLDFLRDYSNFKKQKENKNFKLKIEDLYPRIYDKTVETHIDPVYFYQNSWCAKKIFENKPKEHFDVGSDLKMLGIISQFVSTTMVDIRPPTVSLHGLKFVKGDILKLPFLNNSINSLGSICVIEHIGLGRYGDKFDSFGTEKAIEELVRVLAKNGDLYISVPVHEQNKVYFNAHRVFTRNYVLELFSSLKLMEERYIYDNKMFDKYNKEKGFGTGLYYFKKI